MFCLRLLAVLICTLVWFGTADAAVHPNPKKIGKWNAKITKIQGKIDHENSRATAMVGIVSIPTTVVAVPTAPVTPDVPSAPAAVPVAPPTVMMVTPRPTVILHHRGWFRTRTYVFH